jgi:hypothetical protein
MATARDYRNVVDRTGSSDSLKTNRTRRGRWGDECVHLQEPRLPLGVQVNP